MKVPFVDLQRNYLGIKHEIQAAIVDVLDSSQYILGPNVQAFESSFAQLHGVAHCLGTSSGTDANHLALWALGIGPGDEVIMPVNTFIATAWGITLCGAVPVFVDCEPDSYNIDAAKIEAKITSNTKAIIAVHLYGQPANLDAISAIAKKYRLALIEDAAQAHLAEYNGKPVGGMGHVASFSFYPGKNLGAYGESGAVTTNDDDIATRLRLMRNHGSESKYRHTMLGHNYRMEGIQGAILNVKLKYLADWTERRRRVAAKYCDLLKDVDGIRLPTEMKYAKHVYHLFVIQSDDRDILQEQLTNDGVSTGLHYPIPLHLQPCFSYLQYREGDFPIAETIARHCLSLPMFPEITEEEVAYVTERVRHHKSVLH
jgi:dTDP-4-amino-4,6-dideoxygalactose transaminase